MARLNSVSSIFGDDEGYPQSRCVEGTDTCKVPQNEGAMRQFGKIRRDHREWTNSKTGRRTEAPEYAGNDDGTDRVQGGY